MLKVMLYLERAKKWSHPYRILKVTSWSSHWTLWKFTLILFSSFKILRGQIFRLTFTCINILTAFAQNRFISSSWTPDCSIRSERLKSWSSKMCVSCTLPFSWEMLALQIVLVVRRPPWQPTEGKQSASLVGLEWQPAALWSFEMLWWKPETDRNEWMTWKKLRYNNGDDCSKHLLKKSN